MIKPIAVLLTLYSVPTLALNVVLAGGTGEIGQGLAARLSDHKVTVLTRNAFLAAAPTRVTEQFGWMGASFLRKHPQVSLRDWDGGDLLDIVGCDWIGWQEDTLSKADVVVHLVGGFTPQRTMACERLVRESLTYNKNALHVTVNPTDEDMGAVARLVPKPVKLQRVKECEDMVSVNCLSSLCMRIEANRVSEGCDAIVGAILREKAESSVS